MFFFPSSWNRRSCGRPSNAGARPKKTRVCRTRPTTTRSPSPSSTSPSVLFPSSFSVDFILKKKGIQRRHAEASADAKLNLPLWNTYVPLLQKYCWNKKSDEHNTLFFKKNERGNWKIDRVAPAVARWRWRRDFWVFFSVIPGIVASIRPWNWPLKHKRWPSYP